MPPNIEHLTLYSDVKEIFTPLLMSIEHVLLVAHFRFRFLKTICVKITRNQFVPSFHASFTPLSRLGLGTYESPDSITRMELLSKGKGIQFSMTCDVIRETLLY